MLGNRQQEQVRNDSEEDEQYIDQKEAAQCIDTAAQSNNPVIALTFIEKARININQPDRHGKSVAYYLLKNKSFTKENLKSLIATLLEQRRFEELAYFCRHHSPDLLVIKQEISRYVQGFNIVHPQSKVIHKQLCLNALNPHHPLGEILFTRRAGKKCKPTRGVLNEISVYLAHDLYRDIGNENIGVSNQACLQIYEGSLSPNELNDALRTAAKKGDLETVTRLVEARGADANQRSYERGSALDEAIRGAHTDIAIKLIQNMQTEALSASFAAVIKLGNIHVTEEMIKRFVDLGHFGALNSAIIETRAHKPGLFFSKISAGFHLCDAIKSAKIFIARKIDATADQAEHNKLIDDANDAQSDCGKVLRIARFATECKDTKGLLHIATHKTRI